MVAACESTKRVLKRTAQEATNSSLVDKKPFGISQGAFLSGGQFGGLYYIKHMRKQIQQLVLGVTAVLLMVPGAISAQSSTNYSQDEQFMGSGGSVDGTSGTRDAIGDTGVGPGTSAGSSRIDSGYVTDGDPRLAFIVQTTSVSFGNLSANTTATGTSTFSVLNYTSYGYVVQTVGNPPSSGSYVLSGMPSTTASQVGTEQYGINLRSNTSPITFGADPVQVPDSSFSSGGAAGGYSTADNFRYVQGETVASAAQSSGQTNYTVSYIVNISSATAGGLYTGIQGYICTGTY